MAKRPTKQQFERFLKERNLLPAFRRRQRIKRAYTFEANVQGIRRKFITYKKGNKTIVADFVNLDTQLTTKRFNTRTVRSALAEGKVTPKVLRREILTNVVQTEFKRPQKIPVFSKKQERTINARAKVFVRMKFTSKKGKVVFREGGSQKLRDVTNPDLKKKAVKEAMNGALSQAGFSPLKQEVVWIRYTYFLPRKGDKVILI